MRHRSRPKDKPVILERRAIPERFGSFFLRFVSTDWKRYKRYTDIDSARRAHEKLSRSHWHRDFEYRLNLEVGIVTLPVVKA